jgi:phosphoribosyl 1,2-cyclic phosphodiesterase
VRIASLGSGSKGNATLVQYRDTTLLIDNGFSLRSFCRRLDRFDIDPAAIDALLLTHEHGDHSSGVQRLCAAYSIPLWTAVGTARAVLSPEFEYRRLVAGQPVTIGAIEVLPVTVPHDANEPLQFVFRQSDNGKRLGILTDTGHITRHIAERLSGCDALVIECNHDLEMLMRGPYPTTVKRRVAGDLGHLNNSQSAALIDDLDTGCLQHLVAVHISETNNTRTLALEALASALGVPQNEIGAAGQEGGLDWRRID